MHQDDKFYTFLLSHSTKSNIYIRRIGISKKSLHAGTVSLILITGIFTIGFSGFIKNNLLAEAETIASNNPATLNQQVTLPANNPKAEYKAINYERPASSEEFTAGSGGPFGELTESETDKTGIEGQLRTIEATGNPSFLPTIWSHLGKINNEFGYRRNPFGGRSFEFHAGLDIDGERGDVVAVTANGIVTKSGWEGGYGNLIEVDHGNGLTTRYGHLSKIGVNAGDTVQRGQLIGLIGSTGRSTGPHLHYEVRLNNKPINPRRFLPPEPPEIRALNAE